MLRRTGFSYLKRRPNACSNACKSRDGNFWVQVKVKSWVNKLIWLLIGCTIVNNQSEVRSESWLNYWQWQQLKSFRFRPNTWLGGDELPCWPGSRSYPTGWPAKRTTSNYLPRYPSRSPRRGGQPFTKHWSRNSTPGFIKIWLVITTALAPSKSRWSSIYIIFRFWK